MSTAQRLVLQDARVPMQDASIDIWQTKYRLTAKDGSVIDNTIDDTYKRVARALSEMEATLVADPEVRSANREYWYERFLWALRKGAIPAGRITSNAGEARRG